jgi:predicted amidophosphoribosyltransferase
MTTPAELYTDPYIAIYRRVPPVRAGVCSLCHTGTGGAEYSTCNSCRVTSQQVTYPVQQILPISLYEVPDQYWTVLRNYKDDPWPEVREHTGTILAATVARFTARHWACISAMIGAEPSLVTTVPSTGARRGQHPLARAVRRSSHLLPLYTDVLRRGPGVVRHRYATDNAFLAAADRVRGHRVLLVEDTFTTGARTQSAASALRIAGLGRGCGRCRTGYRSQLERQLPARVAVRSCRALRLQRVLSLRPVIVDRSGVGAMYDVAPLTPPPRQRGPR